ncbi:pyruvate dehydrogenase complex dihydrolipoamide acetyltransferase [Pajaroellobacter abortibovis]|uniref:Acetyltransferase component of pyruvate dehydrogenase complex n=1 Tax=Pajaroellobacter abortibovis TaxID=1882918 RepID=A0A1L6MX46_9BACT|nr:pyruvate dehydrogenase complex dihydrolipoamide acetyltransferase [Pajaroellobacter abortibovis]APS00006.1 pyruvate dehydrogenase complex dihydrolipoamide acetyltransferase [Pajaroellobacter abortibovis]
MAKIINLPKLSPTMEEGVLSAWHKKEGDLIQVDDLLADVETDKATMEFRAFDAGTLLKLLVTQGTQIKLGQAVAIMGNPGEEISSLLSQIQNQFLPATHSVPEKEHTQPKEQPSTDPCSSYTKEEKIESPAIGSSSEKMEISLTGYLERTERSVSELVSIQEKKEGQERVVASPYIRKSARELGISLDTLQGSGPGGRVIASDLEFARLAKQHANQQAEPSLSSPAPEIRPLSPMRKTIARRLTESKQNIPHFYLSIDINVGELVQLRERVNRQLAPVSKASTSSEAPLKISINDFLIRACALALVRVPECNTQMTSDAIMTHKRVDISVAVAIPDGLVTPVIRNADQKSLPIIAQEVRSLATRARIKKLKPEEMQGGTFSISNLGMFGIDQFTAVINPPEGAILAVGQARDEPIVKNGEIVCGKKMSLTLSCDHRVIDGASGASFLRELKGLLEAPLQILVG